jgi:stage II sporulation protein D
MRRLSLLTAAILLTAPAAADAATRIVVRGAGFGHGVGLSQYGAYGLAQHGRSHRQIIGHYYRGTRLSQAASRSVRVLLQSSDPYVRFRGATRVGGRPADPAVMYLVRASRGGLSLRRADGRRTRRLASPLRVSGRGPLRLMGRAINGVTSGRYRGSLELRPSGRGVSAINALPVDDYVKGVVAGEMPFSWHPEALKAQAVVARTYGLAVRKPGGPFDLFPDTRSQVYRGVAGERASTNAAVSATAGQIVTYGGAVATTFYFSTSGGKTENVENSFLGSTPKPWLKGVSDPYDDISPRHRWRLRFTPAQMQARLRGYVRGRFRRILVIRRGVSPRIVRARVYGTRGSANISGPTLRARLTLFDTWAYFTRVSTSRAMPRSARSSLSGPVFGRTVLKGSFEPTPRARRLVLERRAGRVWQRLATVRTSPRGSYRVRVGRPGTYRVRAGGVAGPAVRVT